MNKITKIGIFSGVIVLLGYVICNYNQDIIGTLSHQEEEVTESPEWVEVTAIAVTDTNNVIRVTWDQKYGRTKTEYCRAIFVNKKDRKIKLVSPWITTFIEEANINDLTLERVSKDSMR